MEAAAVLAEGSVGDLVRVWRRRRRLSQLALALDADISARHLSFVETGRSKPSRDTVVRLAETLEVPLRERNALLLAAGYAPLYPQRPLDSEEMKAVREALDRYLRAHEPYPAIVVDRAHNIVAANDASELLTAGCSPALLQPPANAIRLALHPEGLAPRTLNLAEWGGQLMRQLERELSITGDPALESLLAEIREYPGLAQAHTGANRGHDVAVPLRVRAQDGEELAFLSTISTFGTAVDVTLSEISIEAFYPANAATALRLLRDVS
jgi:transcriptional regulator with XRE-family HTH domain